MDLHGLVQQTALFRSGAREIGLGGPSIVRLLRPSPISSELHAAQDLDSQIHLPAACSGDTRFTWQIALALPAQS